MTAVPVQTLNFKMAAFEQNQEFFGTVLFSILPYHQRTRSPFLFRVMTDVGSFADDPDQHQFKVTCQCHQDRNQGFNQRRKTKIALDMIEWIWNHCWESLQDMFYSNIYRFVFKHSWGLSKQKMSNCLNCPDTWHGSRKPNYHFQILEKGYWLLFWILIFSKFIGVPGMEGIPSVNNDWATKDLPPWDGKADPSFRRGWFRLLKVMLGNIYQDRDTLLRCAMGQDVGHQNAVGAGGANPTQLEVDQHQMRRRRLGAVILQKMMPNSYCHILFTSDNNFMNDGVAMYNFLFVQGHRDHSQAEITELQNTWQAATMSNVGIKFDENGLNNWRNWIEKMGEVLNKGNMQKRRKFYDGLPESFEPVVGFESSRPDAGSFVLAAVFPAHHPLAGQANPQGGQPDLTAIVAAFTPSWVNKVKARKIQAVPKGMAHQIEYATREEMMETVNQAVIDSMWQGDTWEDEEMLGKSHSGQLFSAENCDVFQVGMQPDDDWPDNCQVHAATSEDGATEESSRSRL